MTAVASPAEIVSFWRRAGPAAWFAKDEAFDLAIRERFLATYEAAAAGELGAWERTAEGVLALLLVLDQFPRNMFRDSPRAFAADPLAQAVAERAIARGLDRLIAPDLRAFVYLPFEHAEDMAMQERSVALFEPLGNPLYTDYAVIHRDIIARFGRFPHRNAILGRQSTPDELAYLDGDGFKG